MSIGDEVRKLERENEILKDVLDDIGLIRTALSDLLKLVADIETRLGLDTTENKKDATREGTPENETSHQYTVTEHGGESSTSEPYKVDTGQFLGSDYNG